MAQLVKNLPAMQEPWFNLWVGKIPWKGKGYPLQYSGLENSMDCIVHEVAERWARMNDFHFLKRKRCVKNEWSVGSHPFLDWVEVGKEKYRRL